MYNLVLTPHASKTDTSDINYDEFDANVFNYARPKSKVTSKSNVQVHRNVIDYSSAHSSPEASRSAGHIIKKLSYQEDAPIHFNLRRSISEEQTRAQKHGSNTGWLLYLHVN